MLKSGFPVNRNFWQPSIKTQSTLLLLQHCRHLRLRPYPRDESNQVRPARLIDLVARISCIDKRTRDAQVSHHEIAEDEASRGYLAL